MAVSPVLHRVADYDAWRKVYDSVADMQNDGGVTQQSVTGWRMIRTMSWSSTTSTMWSRKDVLCQPGLEGHDAACRCPGRTADRVLRVAPVPKYP